VLSAAVTTAACRTTATQDSALREQGGGGQGGGNAGACAGLDQATGDPVVWLKSLNQLQLAKAFDCAPESTSTPIGFGIGAGTVFQTWPLWSDMQAAIGGVIWGGKRLFKEGERTFLLNKMVSTSTERYKAEVVLLPSLRDGRPSVVLDYRQDESASTLGGTLSPAQKIVDQIVRGIRDEVREIHANGQGTKVYIGRAMLLKRVFIAPPGTLGEKLTVDDSEFADPNAYRLGANFFLDFRGN